MIILKKDRMMSSQSVAL